MSSNFSEINANNHSDHHHLTPHNITIHHIVQNEGGIFAGKGLLNSPLALFLVQATIIIGLSRLIHRGVMYHLRQPRVIAEIIGGICLGPSLLGRIPHFTETIFPTQSLPTLSLISNFGLVLYMFLMGLELDTGLLLKGIKRFTAISLAGIMLPGALGAAVSYGLYEFLLEEEKRAATPFSSFLLFTFVALAITAFPVLARILTEKKLLTTTVGLMTISAAAIDDICAWVLLALTVSIINASGNSMIAIYVLVSISIYAALLLVPGRILLQKAFEKCLGKRAKNAGDKVLTQILLALIFIMVFLSAWTTEWIGVHAIFGAFLAGIIIPRIGGLTVELTHLIEDVVTIVFLPLYFAFSGLKTHLSLLNDWTTALFCVAVIFVACTGKIIGCTTAARLTGFPWREAFSIGVLMNTKGLVELIVLNIGLDAGVINDRIFAVMVVMALVTTFMTSPIIAWVYPPKYHQDRQRVMSKKRQKQLSIGSSIPPQMDDEIERIFVYLQNVDSIPMSANVLQLFRDSLAPGLQMYLNGFKAFTDMERSSHIMVSTQTDRIIESDSTLGMFRFFGKLIGSPTKCFVATTRLIDIGMEMDRLAAEQQCDVIMVPWHKDEDSPGCNQRVATLSILESVRHNTVIIAVDRRPGGTGQLLHHHAPFNGIIVPLLDLNNASENASLNLAIVLHRNMNKLVPVTVMYFVDESKIIGNGNGLAVVKEENNKMLLGIQTELPPNIKKEIQEELQNLKKKLGKDDNVVFHPLKCSNGTDKLQTLKDAILYRSPPRKISDQSSESHELVIIGHHQFANNIADARATLPRKGKKVTVTDESSPTAELSGGQIQAQFRSARSISISSLSSRFGGERRKQSQQQQNLPNAVGMAEEERIFGSLGKLLYEFERNQKQENGGTPAVTYIPSLMVVHELNGGKDEMEKEMNNGKMEGVGA